MKLYVFYGYEDPITAEGEYIIEQVRAENHDEARSESHRPSR